MCASSIKFTLIPFQILYLAEAEPGASRSTSELIYFGGNWLYNILDHYKTME